MSENKPIDHFTVSIGSPEKNVELMTLRPDLTLNINLKEFFVIALRSGWIEDLVLKEMSKKHAEEPPASVKEE